MIDTTSPAIELLHKSGAKLPEILGSVLPVPVYEVAESFEVAKAVAVTAKHVDAVRDLSLSVEGSQALTVTERRVLTQDEIDTLSREREAMDMIEKYIRARKEAQRIMLMNHWDVLVEEGGVDARLDAKRHYLTPAEQYRSDGAKRFVRQLSHAAPSVSADALKEVADSGEVDGFGHDDYLACTTQVRVLDEEKTLIHMRSKPVPVVEALRIAAHPGTVTAALYHR